MNKYELRVTAAIMHEQGRFAENVAAWAIKDAHRLHEVAAKLEKLSEEIALKEGVVVEESAAVVRQD
jgi:hypothetical protein